MRNPPWILAFALLWCTPAAAQVINLGASNDSLCFTSDSDDDQSSPVAYDPGSPACDETGAADINVFGVSSSIAGNGSGSVALDLDAGVVADANPASSEYEAGRIDYGLTVAISGTGGAAWELTIDQELQGLLATVSDGEGTANAGASGATVSLDLGPVLDFGSSASRSSGSTGSQVFSASRLGDVISGVGDVVLAGSVEITIDAFSECGGFLCLGNADEGAVLFGLDDVSGSIFVSADEYSSWGRAVGPDGYRATFTLALTEFCGDGITQPGLGEECDDANTASNDGCSSSCLTEFCGDGIRQAPLGEACDDGNQIEGDGCDNQCNLEQSTVAVPTLSSWMRAVLALSLLALGGLWIARDRAQRT